MLTMYMPSERVLRAICWTLVHSCWQGMLLAFLTGLAILLTRRSTPVKRYNLFSGLFCLFFAGACVTFYIEWGAAGVVHASFDAGKPAGAIKAGGASVVGLPVAGVAMAENAGVWDRLLLFFDVYASWIVAVWFIIFLVRLARITVQLGAVQRMRYYKVKPVEEVWSDRVAGLAVSLGIQQPVLLLESVLVQAPMMAGLFKPVILIPMGLLTQLEPMQVEAVLLHELAHIRRKDYLANLLFSCMEIFFFFNPAVMWLSSLIREEREACCDDVAVAKTGNKRQLIHALLFFQAQDGDGVALAPGFPGSGNHLLKRVRRMLYRDNKLLDRREQLFLGICMLLLCGLGLAFSGHRASRSVGVAREVRLVPAAVGDTSRPEAREAWEAIRRTQDSLETERKRLQEAGAKLADEEQLLARRAQELAGKENNWDDEYKQKMLAQLADKQAKHSGEEAMRAKLLYEKQLQEQQQLKIAKEALTLRDLQGLRVDSQKIPVNELVLQMNTADAVHLGQINALRLMDSFQPVSSQKAYEQQLEQNNRQLLKLKDEQAGRLPALQKLQAERSARLALKQSELSLSKQNDVLLGNTGNPMQQAVDPIIADLLERKLISDPQKFTFSLDKNELKVNDVRQPAETFAYFRKKYVADSRNKYRYLRNGSAVTMMVEKY